MASSTLPLRCLSAPPCFCFRNEAVLFKSTCVVPAIETAADSTSLALAILSLDVAAGGFAPRGSVLGYQGPTVLFLSGDRNGTAVRIVPGLPLPAGDTAVPGYPFGSGEEDLTLAMCLSAPVTSTFACCFSWRVFTRTSAAAIPLDPFRPDPLCRDAGVIFTAARITEAMLATLPWAATPPPR